MVYRDTRLSSMQKWSASLGIDITNNSVFKHFLKTTRDTQLRWFQFRLLHRTLPCQRYLFLRKIVNTPVCNFCTQEEQTLEHLLWDCDKTQEFWFDLLVWLHANFNHSSHFRFSKQLVILGHVPGVYTDKVIDLFILLAKYHIYYANLNHSAPHLQVFIRLIKQRYKIERLNSCLEFKQVNFYREWGPYMHYFL